MDSGNNMRELQNAPPSPADDEEIRPLAYQFWLERGCPIGTPETDWFRAEAELKASAGDDDTALLTVAKTIGSTLGSVATLVSPKG